MGPGRAERMHAGSTAGAMGRTRRVAGEPQAMDKPPWDAYYALGTRT